MLESEAFQDAKVVQGRRWDVRREMIKEKISYAVCALKQGKASSCVFFFLTREPFLMIDA